MTMNMMQKEHYDNWKKYIESELKESGFDQSDFGKAVFQLLIETYKITNGEPLVMGQLLNIVSKLSQNLPITLITEKDFEDVSIKDGDNNVTVSVCKKFPSVYKCPTDGNYYNDRGIAFVDSNGNKMYMSNGEHRSKVQIQLPYALQEKIVHI